MYVEKTKKIKRKKGELEKERVIREIIGNAHIYTHTCIDAAVALWAGLLLNEKYELTVFGSSGVALCIFVR